MTNTDTLEGVINNQFPVERSILTAGYNEYDVENDVRNTARKERKKGHFFINHLILRDKANYLHNVKSTYPLAGIPIIAWGMMNLYQSHIMENVTVGNDDSNAISDDFIDFYDANREHERLMFEPEGDKWSIGNTWG